MRVCILGAGGIIPGCNAANDEIRSVLITGDASTTGFQSTGGEAGGDIRNIFSGSGGSRLVDDSGSEFT